MRSRMIAARQVTLTGSQGITEAAHAELEAAVREHAGFVYRVAYSALGNRQDAEEVAQETFFRFWRSRKKWAGIRDRRGWLARTVWRAALNRRGKPLEVGFEEAAEAVGELRARGAGAEELAANRQMVALLDRLIAALPSELRDVLTLSTIEEMSSAEIAEILGIPPGSVRTRLMRAREMLRAKLSVLLETKHER
jgi:RNA polymerase sigma-70 factor (ECF subfamily)